MVVKISADSCIGCGLCESACPEVYKMDGDKAVVSVASIPAAAADSCRQAATDCPVSAIEVS